MTDDPNTALFLLDYLTEPRIKPRHGYFNGTFEPVGREHDVTLRDIWEKVFRANLESYAGQYLDIVERHLRRADLQLAIASESDRLRPSNFRAAIAIIEAYGLDGPLGFLADVARECIDYLISQKDRDGPRRLDAWATCDVSLLQRLAVYGYDRRTDVSASEKLEWLHRSEFLNERQLRSEVQQLIAVNVASATPEIIETLVGDIVSGLEASK